MPILEMTGTRIGKAMLAAILFASGVVAQQKPFTLEQVMSSPFPTELNAAPTGGKVAWVFNERGARNIWIAGPDAGSGGYKSHRLTNFKEDDGQDLAELAWIPNASAIVFSRGGDFENDGAYPNPASNPAGVDQAIWVISASGGAPRRLGEGHSPAVSPRGDSVAFIFKDQIWLAKLTGAEKASQLIHSRGKVEEIRWSPAGDALAFVSARGDHNLIGVYELSHTILHYLDPSVDRDRNPVWSPDGRQIAFIRIAASSEAFAFGPKRTAQPWSIRVADARTGAGNEIWKAGAGRGSAFRGLDADEQLYWTAGNQLIFPWEGDGWTHLYSVPAGGGAATLLTPGEFEVENASLSPNRSEVLISSNQGDLDRRHVWRLEVSSPGPKPVTGGAGIEWWPVESSDGKTIFVLRSNARRPARPAFVTDNGELRDLAPETMPSDFPASALVVPQQVMISSTDGMRIHAQLFLPRDIKPEEKRPAVVFFHGGSRREMLLGWHYMAYYHNAYAMNQFLASQGTIVLSVNYRSGIGYGMEFREALNYGATGASEFNDVMGAGLYLRSRPDVDPKRIGLWGGSYGGYLTALGLARASDLFAAGVDMHGVHNWNLEIHHFVPAYDPEATPDLARIALESSPIYFVKTWRSPVLLIQGDDDRNVPFHENVEMAEALRKQGVYFEELVFPDEIHEFLMHRTWLAAYHAASDFLDKELKR